MSTPRKNYFLGPCEILRLPWPREIKYAYLMLSAAMVDRWRSDNLDRLDAERIVLSRGLLYDVTGCEHAKHARQRLVDLASRLIECRGELGEMSIEPRGDLTAIHWRNLADFQQLPSGRRATGGPDEARILPVSAAASASASASSLPTPEESSKDGASTGVQGGAPPAPPMQTALPGMEQKAKPERKRGRKQQGVQTPPPDEIPEAWYAELEAMAWKEVPSEAPRVRYHVARCLDNARAKGWQYVNWKAALANWIRGAPEYAPQNGHRNGAAPPPAVDAKPSAESIQRAADEIKRMQAEREADAQRRARERADWDR